MSSHMYILKFWLFSPTPPLLSLLTANPEVVLPNSLPTSLMLFFLSDSLSSIMAPSMSRGLFITHYPTKGNVSMVLKYHFVLVSIPLSLWSLYNTKSSFNWETQPVTPQRKGDYEHHIELLDMCAESLTLGIPFSYSYTLMYSWRQLVASKGPSPEWMDWDWNPVLFLFEQRLTDTFREDWHNV